jgi:hypothetical protein
MTDGSVQRINFAGKSGHAYTPIGRTLVERGDMALEDVTMDSLRAWLAAATPEDRDAVLASNRSFIFFAMAEDVRSRCRSCRRGRRAADARSQPRGRPASAHLRHADICSVRLPCRRKMTQPLSRLMIAQDTGSAIVGPARGDIFIGSGREAGPFAGRGQPAGHLHPSSAKSCGEHDAMIMTVSKSQRPDAKPAHRGGPLGRVKRTVDPLDAKPARPLLPGAWRTIWKAVGPPMPTSGMARNCATAIRPSMAGAMKHHRPHLEAREHGGQQLRQQTPDHRPRCPAAAG